MDARTTTSERTSFGTSPHGLGDTIFPLRSERAESVITVATAAAGVNPIVTIVDFFALGEDLSR